MVGGCLTVSLPSCSPQSGQAYYINDGESVNLFEWMAPLVGAQMPPSSENSGMPTSSLPVILSYFRKIRFYIQSLLWKPCPLANIGTSWSWVVAALFLGGGHVLPVYHSPSQPASRFMLAPALWNFACDYHAMR